MVPSSQGSPGSPGALGLHQWGLWGWGWRWRCCIRVVDCSSVRIDNARVSGNQSSDCIVAGCLSELLRRRTALEGPGVGINARVGKEERDEGCGACRGRNVERCKAEVSCCVRVDALV